MYTCPRWYYRRDFRVRPVTKEDGWCRFTDYKAPLNSAPYGWVVFIPNYRHGMVLSLDGHILRRKLTKNGLYVQVSPFPCRYGKTKEYIIQLEDVETTKKDGTKVRRTAFNLVNARKH